MTAAVGDLIICAFRHSYLSVGDVPTPRLTWNGLSFTKVKSATQIQAGNTHVLGVYVLLVTAGNAGTANITLEWEEEIAGSSAACLAESWAGVASATPNKSASAAGSSGAPNSGSTTPTVNHSAVFCVATRSGNPTTEGTWAAGLTDSGHGHWGTAHMSSAYQILTTATAVAAQKTSTTSGYWMAIVAAFEGLPNTADGRSWAHQMF